MSDPEDVKHDRDVRIDELKVQLAEKEYTDELVPQRDAELMKLLNERDDNP